MDAGWILTEVVRVDADRTALYVLRNPGQLHTATIEARPEYDPIAAILDDGAARPGWIRYFVTWSRSGAAYVDQMNSLSLTRLVTLVSAWERQVAEDPSLQHRLEDLSRTIDRLHYAAVENVQWGIPATKIRLRVASAAYESESRQMRETVDAVWGCRSADAPHAQFEFYPEHADAVMRSRQVSVSV